MDNQQTFYVDIYDENLHGDGPGYKVPHTIYINIANVEYGFILFHHCSGVNQIECGKDDYYKEYVGLQPEIQI